MSEQKLFKEMKVFSLRRMPESIRNNDKIDNYLSMVDGAIFLHVKKDKYNFPELEPLIEWLLENGCVKGEEIIII